MKRLTHLLTPARSWLPPTIAVILFVGGLASVLRAAEPTDPTKNYLGINVDFCSDWSGTNAFADIMIHARPWRDASWSTNATIDSNGWPTEDCSTIIFGKNNQLGVYKLIFTGQAQSISSLFGGSTVSNIVYNSSTNTTTADVDLTDNVDSTGLVFTGTKRLPSDSAGTGITNVRLYRPGEPTDGSTILSSQMKALLEKFEVVRFMNWVDTNTNPLVSWSQRPLPGQARKPDVTINGNTGPVGLPLEYMVAACNETNCDMWINLPINCDDDYITKLAELIRYGSDGVNPYTSTQSNPVWAPLNSNLKVYVEYANEIWNTAGSFESYPWIKAKVDAIINDGVINSPIEFDGNQDETTLIARYAAWREVTASNLFRAVFGDAAMNTRVRPVMMGQIGGNWANPRQLPWIDAYYGTYRAASDPFPNTNPHPVDYYLYGAGGSAYYGVNTWSSDPNTFFATTNYPSTWFINDIGADAVRSMNYGLKRIAYEGGMGLDSSGFTDAQKQTINSDPRMQTLTEDYHDAWSAMGGDLLVYYVTTGAIDWEFTWDPAVLNSPKLLAADSIRNSSRAAVTIGVTVPGNLAARDEDSIRDTNGSFFNTTIQGVDCVGGVDNGEWIALGFAAPSDGTTTFNVRLASTTTSKTIPITINGTPSGSITFTGQGNSTLMNTSSLTVPVHRGLNVIRLGASGGSYNLQGVDFTSFTASSGGGTVATPSFSPAGGTYTSAQTVTLSTATSGATIRYTTDGSTPSSTTGTVYSSPVSISATTTLKAIAYESGMTDSAVATATYTINSGSSSNVYQAEDGTVAGGSAVSTSLSGYTGTGYVDFGGNGSSLTLSNVSGTGSAQTLTFYYANGGTVNRQCSVSVNGVNIGNVTFAPTGSWTTWVGTSISATLTSGSSNTIVITANTSNGGPNLDRMEVVTAFSTTIEAEDGTYGGGSVVDTAQAGYQGTGYVDFGGNGAWSQCTVTVPSAGTYTVTFRYANGSTNTRDCVVSVNGSGSTARTFPNTGGWTTWGTVSLNLTLAAGSNTIRATASTTSGGPNLDNYTISQ